MKKFVLYTAAAVATGLCAVGFAPDAHAASGLRCAPPAGTGVVKNPLICRVIYTPQPKRCAPPTGTGVVKNPLICRVVVTYGRTTLAVAR